MGLGELIAILGAVGGAVGLVALIVVIVRQKKRAFNDALARDPDVEPIEVPANVSCRTRREPWVTAVAGGGGKNNPRRWDTTGRASKLGQRTTLHVSREGAVGGIRELMGWKDVHTGDAEFDKAFTIKGSEPDVVRGVFASADVRDAVRGLFQVSSYFSGQTGVRGWEFNVRDGGAVHARIGRGGWHPGEAKAAVLAVQRLIGALEAVADVPALPEPLATSVSGSASGAPVGVPIGGRGVP